MEFPHIGKNCSYNTCNKLVWIRQRFPGASSFLDDGDYAYVKKPRRSESTPLTTDFLPMKCGACKDVFCSDHFAYVKHECPVPNTRDIQVPTCPLCGSVVPGRRGEPPDVAVGAHIDNQCTSDPAKERRKKVFTNRCSLKGCKTKEMVPLVCVECSLNYCLRHRHTTDHACEGKLAAKRRQAAEAAMARMKANESRARQNNIPTAIPVRTMRDVQGNMTEDEALAHALALSMEEETNSNRERPFARALTQRAGGEQNSRCTVS